MPTWWAKARKFNKKVPDATNVATAATNSGKTVENTGFFQIQRMKLKLARGLLNRLHSIIDLTGQEK